MSKARKYLPNGIVDSTMSTHAELQFVLLESYTNRSILGLIVINYSVLAAQVTRIYSHYSHFLYILSISFLHFNGKKQGIPLMKKAKYLEMVTLPMFTFKRVCCPILSGYN